MSKDKYEEVQDYCAKKYKKDVTTGKKDIGDFYLHPKYPVNVKSNNVDKKNYSPNIISAKKLLVWLMDDGNEFGLIFVDYKIENNKLKILYESDIIPIENISWDCLTIEAQGYGVIQKKDDLKIDKKQDKKQFIEGLKKAYEIYKSKEDKKRIEMDNLISEFLRKH